jgi:CheY-like chemotaxis protein
MSNPLRVLCVDDNRQAAGSISEVLTMAGCDVRVCLDGETALTVAEEFHPDVCVLDIHMPKMDGNELATRLRERTHQPTLRCIALTGLWDIDTQHKTHNAGFEGHLVKPVEMNRLIEAVTGCYTPVAT